MRPGRSDRESVPFPLRGTLVTAAVVILLAGACSHPRPPRLAYAEIQSRSEKRALPIAVYTPPGWDGTTPLPLVVLLHGAGDDERVLERFPVVLETLDRWTRAGRIPPLVMVVPRGERGFWHNWYDGSHNYEDYVMDDLVTEMYARYPLIPGREGLHLMGVSMGGAGALYMALHHRGEIASAIVVSAPLFDVDQTMDFLGGRGLGGRFPVARVFGPPERARVEADNPYALLQGPEDLLGMRLFLGAGTRDRKGLLESTESLHAHLERHGVPHDFLVYQGRHKWRDWARVFPVALCLQLQAGCELPADVSYRLVSRQPD